MAEKGTSNKELPLAGVVLCFTSILPEQRTDLATVASQMGAIHKFDLTSDVTHLIVGEINTPKYKFVARERSDVTVLKPEWIEAVRQSWMQGEDTDIRALEEHHRLPTFAGLSICITGFEDMAFRNYVQNTAAANGAEFKKDLTKGVTHLVALNTEGQKYKFATQWNIKVVTVKWFSDSIERGMVLEETLYHPLLPQEKQGAGAWNRSLPAAKEKVPLNDSSSNPRPRKLRRIASAKLGDQNEGIWGDIVGTGFENTDLKGSRDSQPKSNGPVPSRSASVIQEAKSFASETTFPDAQGSHQQTPEIASNRQDGFLQDCYFFVSGFSSRQTSVLRQHLSFNGAQLVESLSEFSRPDIPKRGHSLYIIVSYKTPKSEIPSTEDMAFECEVVTDMWLERCLDAKTLVPPEAHVACTPVPKFPMPEFHGMKICSTGFSRIDLLHLSKLVGLIGASYNEYLTPSASVLLCNDPRSVNHDKLRHTSEWGIPAVSADWLWVSIQTGEKKSFEPYIIRKQLSQKDKGLELRAGSRTEKERRPDNSDKTNKDTQPNTNNGPAEMKENIPNIQKTGHAKKLSKPTENDEQLKKKSEIPQKRPALYQSASPSPSKDQDQNTAGSSIKRSESTHSTSSAAPSAIDLAVSGILKNARTANTRQGSDLGELNDGVRSRKRKPLLGRAPSHPNEHMGFSRASSIDTLNEDGCGSAVESDTGTRSNSRGGPSFTSLINGGRVEFDEDASLGRVDEYPDSQEPAMTQLNYEDPDAVAMREEFLSHAGKLVNKKPSADQKLVVGEVKELEDVGWGTGRRTRKAAKPAEDLESQF
ncbi:hypothetical protein ASPWEDRAFT_131595 [Aspergillus wentii DTO 134E9]|uniref:BRCT domain-containing protein n=1 Tax=Aspergillus wentii DTO 134E9 TaxID=1073089 RepID=A0A1L9RR07_ASPWE|nr:uncharacterized protein ASPWEDRAFT_131595 [Aspergillus wentii DTO 134E9]KAI9928125.1 hypothetical protein MW887_002158 [Aspergillus wentii]OJJ37396.1 hypothetical protein ASPWEDRAFT_131595 [Aspergillus wentii DTO 134E9]